MIIIIIVHTNACALTSVVNNQTKQMLPLFFHVCVYVLSIDDSDERERMKFLFCCCLQVFLGFPLYGILSQNNSKHVLFFLDAFIYIYIYIYMTVKCVCNLIIIYFDDGRKLLFFSKRWIMPVGKFSFSGLSNTCIYIYIYICMRYKIN